MASGARMLEAPQHAACGAIGVNTTIAAPAMFIDHAPQFGRHWCAAHGRAQITVQQENQAALRLGGASSRWLPH